MAPLGLNNEESVWKMFLGIMDGMLLARFMDYDGCYFYWLFTVAAEETFSGCFLEGGCQFCYVVVLEEYIGKRAPF